MSQEPGKKYRVRAEFVGVNQYNDPSLGRLLQLRYACDDALEMAGVISCARSLLIEQDCFQVHTDAQALHHVVLPALNRVFASGRPVERDVLALFYFSGHGVIHPFDDRVFLCCHDVNFMNPYSGGISLNQIYEFLQRSSAGYSVAIIDACFSGAMTDPKRVSYLTPVELARRSMASLLDRQEKNVAIFLSCRGDQQAREDEQKQHGIYTYEILRGWRDGEASDREGCVTLTGLKDYLEKRFEKDRQKPIASVLGGERLVIWQEEPHGELPEVRPIPRADLPKPLTHLGGRVQIPIAPQTGSLNAPIAEGNRRQLLKSLTLPLLAGASLLAACALSTIFIQPLQTGFFALVFALSIGLPLVGMVFTRLTAFLLLVQMPLAAGFAYRHFLWGAGSGPLSSVLAFLANFEWLGWLVLILEILFLCGYALNASMR